MLLKIKYFQLIQLFLISIFSNTCIIHIKYKEFQLLTSHHLNVVLRTLFKSSFQAADNTWKSLYHFTFKVINQHILVE